MHQPQPSMLSRKKLKYFFRFNFILLLIVMLGACSTSSSAQWKNADADPTYYNINQYTKDTDEGVDQMIAPYYEILAKEMNEVIGEVAHSMTKRKPESTLGNWVSDVIKAEANKQRDRPIDFAVQNYGGIRVNEIAKGPIQVKKIYELMPFDNLLVVLEVPGSLLKKFIHHMAAGDGWPISDGLSYEIVDEQASNILVNGEQIDERRNYSFALPDYIANGGDNCSFLSDIKQEQYGTIRDAIISQVRDYTKRGETLSAEILGRVKRAQ